MNKILSNIRSVPGVWGTIAIDKKRALTYQMLPANYSTEAVKNIAIPTLNLARSAEKNMVIDLFFKTVRPESTIIAMRWCWFWAARSSISICSPRFAREL